jgi:hypothetical protein
MTVSFHLLLIADGFDFSELLNTQSVVNTKRATVLWNLMLFLLSSQSMSSTLNVSSLHKLLLEFETRKKYLLSECLSATEQKQSSLQRLLRYDCRSHGELDPHVIALSNKVKFFELIAPKDGVGKCIVD